ncbi:DUF4232 domain-containing protein [Kitasatospora sp. NPDC052896]|uniref:DUF4232 domain-containing protein n=1 Tax=Kitasatospora sp. NPDC052896 TaxID=3364061 RepID=UPI0037C4F64C
MTNFVSKRAALLAAGVAALGLSLTACGSGGSTASAGAAGAPAAGSSVAAAAGSVTSGGGGTAQQTGAQTSGGGRTGSTGSGSTGTKGTGGSASGTAQAGGPGMSAGGGPGNGCTPGQVSVTSADGGAGMGHQGVVLVFRNTSSNGCSLYGYPGVAAVDASGKQVDQAQRTLNGYLGGAQSVTAVQLAPGAQASALLEGDDVPSGNKPCLTYASLLVTPPGTKTSTPLGVTVADCDGLQVHPVVTGASGSAQ